MKGRELTDKVTGWPAVATVTFFVYAWTTSPGIGWLDSPEFVAASHTLGVAHSPGHPLPVFFGKIIALLPFGDLAFRVNIASALAAAGAAVAVWFATLFAVQQVAPNLPTRTARVFAFSAALLYAFSASTWLQATRAEVYALQTALLAGATALTLAFEASKSTKHLALATLLTGLALSNHHFMAVLFFLPTAVFVLWRRPFPAWRTLATAAATGCMGLSLFLYLPVRSLTHPLVNWGAPHTLERLWWTISAKAFQGAPTRERVSTFLEDAAQITFEVLTAFPFAITLAALCSLYVFIRFRTFRRQALWLSTLLGVSGAGLALIGFDADIPDHHGYLTGGLFVLPILAVCGLVAVVEQLRSLRPALARWTPLVACVLLLSVPIELATRWSDVDQSDCYASDAVAQWEMAEIPPRAVVLLAYNQTSFRIQALQAIEAARPDVAFLDRSLLTYPGHAEETKRRYPDMAKVIDAPLKAGEPTPIKTLREVTRTRPVLVQLHPNLDEQAFPALVPQGPFALLAGGELTAVVRESAEELDFQARARLINAIAQEGRPKSALDEQNAALTVLWFDATTISFYCTIRRRAAAERTFAETIKAFPQETGLTELMRTCGAQP